ncbi:MAG: YdeI/OmpD-associated family protein [Steroidobacteraceae bacterium]
MNGTEANPAYFKSAAQLRRWFQINARSRRSLWVGYYKVATGKDHLSWQQSVDEALCFGWIDGIRKRVDQGRYKIRFSPRNAGSTWSRANTERALGLLKQGRMTVAGRTAFAARRENRSGVYSYETRPADLPAPYKAELRRDSVAFEFFTSQVPSYRRAAIWWVISAKREATRQGRLQQLILDSRRGLRIRQFLAAKPQRKTRA